MRQREIFSLPDKGADDEKIQIELERLTLIYMSNTKAIDV